MPDKIERNLRLEIEYDGTNYCGWQTQKNLRHRKTIQDAIEKTLRKIIQEEIHLIVSGRTDAGVHARAQVVNFKTSRAISAKKLQIALNGLLPDDIAVRKISEAPLDFHSRFDAKSKLYRYVILNRPYSAPLLRKEVYFYPHPLNISLMRREAKALLGRHNFRSFQATEKKEKNPFKSIKKIGITRKGPFLRIDIEADGFLYNMMRNIVGTLISVGRGRLPKGSLKRILMAKDRRAAGQTAPARGLSLIKVRY